MNNQTHDGCGWKLLNQYGATIYNDVETFYPVPRGEEKYGPWFIHPEPGEPDGRDCGPGGWHLMITRGPDARYAPSGWWPWFAQYRQPLGASQAKVRAVEIRLRRVPRKVFWRIIRLGWLRGADLWGANLWKANLREANLREANLREANLREANLSGANLGEANLSGADLRLANLGEANLRLANLGEANLRGADLRGADLWKADLGGARHNHYTQWPAGYTPPEDASG